MRPARPAVAVLMGAIGWLVAEPSPAQQATIATPFRSINDSFFERIGVNWGLNVKGVQFNFGGFNQATPPFGGYNGSANPGMRTGFYIGAPGGTNAAFNIEAAQGYQQSMVTQVPSVTLMNGQTGYTSDTSQTPFVISFIPVVGGFPSVYSLTPPALPPAYPPTGMGYSGGGQNPRVQAMRRALAERQQAAAEQAARQAGVGGLGMQAAPPAAAARAPKPKRDEDEEPRLPQPPPLPEGVKDIARLNSAQDSSAGRAAPSVAEARRLHEMEKASQEKEALVLWERAVAAEEDGKPGVAKIYYQMVARRASGELKERALAKVSALSTAAKP